MPGMFDRLSKVRPYRIAAPVLLAGVVLVTAGLVWIGVWETIAKLVGLTMLIVLTVLTYKRHRDAGFTGTLVLLMIVPFSIGPSWDGLPPFEFDLSTPLTLLPILWGCLFESVEGADLQRATAVTRAR